VIDVGDFLSLGAHSVRIPFGNLTVQRETDGADVRLYMDTTKDRLKAALSHAPIGTTAPRDTEGCARRLGAAPIGPAGCAFV